MQFINRARKPLLLFAIGMVLLFASFIIGNWYRWMPLSFPVDLRGGSHQQSSSFKVNLTSNYLIEIEVDRSLPFERSNCLLGIQPVSEQCSDGPVVDIRWSVFSLGMQVANGTSDQEHDGSWGSQISRTIGRFRGENGHEYQINIESLNDGSALKDANPRVVVRVHPFESKGYQAVAQVVLWVAFSIVAASLVWLVIVLPRNTPASRRYLI